MTNFRKMEETGGAMGLSETLNADLTSSSGSNNIDVRMTRTTEYGAIAILSASGYGNSQTLKNSTIKTTTGNKTGVYLSGENWEYNAGGLENSIFSGVNKKYYDTYTRARNSARVGDALEKEQIMDVRVGIRRLTPGWVDGSDPYFIRDGGGVFSFSYYRNISAYGGRGVAVCGEGL